MLALGSATPAGNGTNRAADGEARAAQSCAGPPPDMTQPALASCGAPGRVYAATLSKYATTKSPWTSPAMDRYRSTGRSHSGLSLPSGEILPTRLSSTSSTDLSLKSSICTRTPRGGDVRRQRSWPAENPVIVSMKGGGWQEGELGGQFRAMGAITAVTTRPSSNTISPPVTAIESRKGTRGSRISLPLLSTAMIGG